MKLVNSVGVTLSECWVEVIYLFVCLFWRIVDLFDFIFFNLKPNKLKKNKKKKKFDKDERKREQDVCYQMINSILPFFFKLFVSQEEEVACSVVDFSQSLIGIVLF